MKKSYILAALLAVAFAVPASAHEVNPIEQEPTAHSGGTDHCGCHYNRKTGEYHCHTRKQRGGDCPA